MTALEILSRLVAFDTTSRNSNLELIGFVENYLREHGVESRRVMNPERNKANLFATIGQERGGGIILSGHTDCVPVDGQNWSTDPFVLTQKNGRLYGRGTSDMKGFLACAMAVVPDLVVSPRPSPVHLAFSFDEEVGCTGVRSLISDLSERGLKPAACLVGEPTEMGLVIGHKGGRAYRCTVTGFEAHSSLTPLGVNAIEIAAEIIAEIRKIAEEFASGEQDDAFDIPHSTISTGLIEGGTGINIVPKSCSFVFEYRLLPGLDPDSIFDRLNAKAQSLLVSRMRPVAPEADIRFDMLFDYPAHSIEPGQPVVAAMASLLGSNRLGKVAYGTEAGLFSRDLGVPTIVCGPGSIATAHKPDEWVATEQLDRCVDILKRFCANHA